MRELTISDMELVGGAANWGQVGAGITSVGLAVAIAATPVGWVGAAGAGLAAYIGGLMIGDGFANNGIFESDQG